MGNMTAFGELIPPGEAALVAILGYLVVFAGLILLMFVITGLGTCKLLKGEEKPVLKKAGQAIGASVTGTKDATGMPEEVAMMAAVVIMEHTSKNSISKE